MPAEHADFERAIDANPLDATNHLVYADFLDEQGEHDEAAFRRSMGEWVGEHDIRNLPSTGTTVGIHPNKRLNSFENYHVEELPWRIYGNYAGSYPTKAILPKGVDVPDYWHNEPGQPGDTVIHDMSGTLGALGGTTVSATLPPPNHVAEWRPGRGGSMRWRTYRGMEEGLRRAFMVGRKQQKPEQLHRRRLSLKKYRR